MTTEQTDPIAQLLRAPGTLGRIAALVLGSVSLFQTAVAIEPWWLGTTASTLDVVELAWLFPVGVGFALMISAIAPIAQYARLVDLAASVVGVIVCSLLLVRCFGALANAGKEMHDRIMSGRSAGFGPDREFWSVTPGLGVLAIAIATIIMILVVVRGRPRRAA